MGFQGFGLKSGVAEDAQSVEERNELTGAD